MAERSKSRRRVAVALVALAAAGAIAWVAFGGRMSWPGGDAGPAASSAAPDAGAGIPSRPGDAFPMTVASVWDGDTLRASALEPNDLFDSTDEVRIRVIGVDAPERSPDECWALEARDVLLTLLPPGSTVWVEPGPDPVDRYERALLYLWTADGRFVNHELVALGAAETLTIAPNVEHAELLAVAQAAAEASGAGKWGACP